MYWTHQLECLAKKVELTQSLPKYLLTKNAMAFKLENTSFIHYNKLGLR